jgi:hypothetical protein
LGAENSGAISRDGEGGTTLLCFVAIFWGSRGNGGADESTGRSVSPLPRGQDNFALFHPKQHFPLLENSEVSFIRRYQL